MADNEIILEAYDEAVKKIFTNFYEFWGSADSPAKKTEAEQRFVRGIQAVRDARKRATEILPKS